MNLLLHLVLGLAARVKGLATYVTKWRTQRMLGVWKENQSYIDTLRAVLKQACHDYSLKFSVLLFFWGKILIVFLFVAILRYNGEILRRSCAAAFKQVRNFKKRTRNDLFSEKLHFNQSKENTSEKKIFSDLFFCILNCG